MKVKCIKDVVMDWPGNEIAFFEGKTYEVEIDYKGRLSARNEIGDDDHVIKDDYNLTWFKEHFTEVIDETNKVKYILLYNLGEDNIADERNKNKVLKAIPEAKIIPEQVMMGKSHEGDSLWIPEDKFLIGWTIFNYEGLLRITFDDWESEVVADDGVEWFERHRNTESLVRWL